MEKTWNTITLNRVLSKLKLILICLIQNLSTEDYRKIMKVVEKAILSTDLALYFRKKNLFQEVANTGEIDWQEDGKKDCMYFLYCILKSFLTYIHLHCFIFMNQS